MGGSDDEYLVSIIKSAFDPLSQNSIPARMAEHDKRLTNIERAIIDQNKALDRRVIYTTTLYGAIATLLAALISIVFPLLINNANSRPTPAIPAPKNTNTESI